MNFSLAQLAVAAPEIVLAMAACFILVIDVFLPPSKKFFTYLMVQLTLVLTFILVIPEFGEFPYPTVIFAGHYVIDQLAVIAKLCIYFFSLFAFTYAREYLLMRDIARSEYYVLGLLAVLGMSIMASAASFLTVFLGLELMSLSLYAMVAIDKKSLLASEAAMKYFILGSFATAIFLYGISLLFGLTNSIALAEIGLVLPGKIGLAPVVALIFILAGLIFKFGAVPFHMWVPDVYQGAPTPTTLFIAGAPKIAAFAITLRILVEAMPHLAVQWSQMLIVVAILSMLFGNLLAIAQTNLKRMLAYSSIAHIGYTLLGIIAGPHSKLGYSAAMFYMATYVLVAGGAFAIITIMSRDGIDFDKLEDYRGLNARQPWLAFLMLLLLFSMAGVPPTVGFIAKLGLIEALVQAHLTWLAVVALMCALIGAYYYLRVVMLMYFEEPNEYAPHHQIRMSPDMVIAISINGAAALGLGLLPSYFIDLCRISLG